jgi:hypothetical protein
MEIVSATNSSYRRGFVGGSDARTIMGHDEAALTRLWREKRGEVEPEDLSANLTVQLGTVTEHLNRHWYERNTGQLVTQRAVAHLDGVGEGIAQRLPDLRVALAQMLVGGIAHRKAMSLR